MADIEGFRLSQQQRRVWAFHESPAARSVAVAEFEEPPDHEVLATGLRRVVDRHEVLRTSFVTVPGRRLPLQVPGAGQEVVVRSIESGADGSEAVEFAARLAHQLPLDVTKAVTLGAILVVSPTRTLLGLAVSALAADGASTALIIEELLGALRDSGSGSSGASATDGIRYVSYAAWQERETQGASGLPAQLSAEEELAECLQVRLPFQQIPADDETSATTATLELELPKGGSKGLRDAATRLGVAPADLVLAYWQTVLWRLTGESRFTVGVLASGRTVDGLADAVGPFARLLPVQVGIDAHTTLGELAKATRQGVVAALADEHRFAWPDGADFGDLIFPFAFLHEITPEVPDLLVLDSLPDRFVAGLVLCEAADAVRLELRYATAVLPEAFARSIARQLEAIVVNGPQSLDSLIGHVGVTAAPVASTEPGPVAAAPGELVHEMVLRAADRTPDSVAVHDGERQVSYAELAGQVRRWRRLLSASGVAEGSRVVLLLDRTADLLAVPIAAMALGATFVPLDPATGAERLSQVFAECAPAVVVASKSRVAQLPPGPPVLIAEEQPQVPDAHLPPTWTGDPETHCYLIYTSGSTGAPKATIITHANLAAYVSSLWVTLGLTPADRYLHTASSGFSSAIRQQFLPLSHGATVILSSAKEIMDPIRLLRSVPDRGVTVIDLVPSYWSRLCAVIRQDRGSLGADIKNSELRLLLSASEPLTAAVADAIDQIRPGDARLVNMYGLTETSGIAATLEIRRGDRLSDPLPIGRPIPDVTVMVADQLLAEVSMGTTGEIVVVGHTVGAGYENDEERTAERFSVTRLPGGLVTRAFRTGDLGRRMPGGRIQFVGRRDKQVKIRGFRVEPAEIEAALARHPAVQEVAVLIHRDANGDNALRAFILPHRDQRPTRVDIVSFVRNSLPSYMIPASFHLLSLFPRTASGKVDAIALAQADVNSPSIRKYVPPVTEEEIALTEIWVDVLKLERVGLHDDFFDLGGHSLLGLDTLARLQERFGVTVQWSEVFLNPTVAELAGHVSRLRSGIGRVDALRSPAEPAST